MSAGVVGSAALWAAIGLAIVAVVTGRRRALLASTVAVAAATVVLVIALVTADFSLAYVAETTSLATPWPYRLAALWGGMDGSLLFYTALAMVVGVAALKRPIPVRIVAAAGAGLLLITGFFADPFTVLDIPAVDGGGLLAILQHPAMVYHPPILYLGLTTLIVPFALTVEMALGRGVRETWMARARRWVYVSWTLLTLGMVAGASWAYAELGWGGFWAWDPVENTALMPWIAATVFLHTSRIEDATGRWRRWNVMFASLPFALTIMGVYLTRSGATGSIHSFAEDPVVGGILLVTSAVVALLALTMAVRSKTGEGWDTLRFDRNGWLAINAMLLTTALVFVTAGSAYPAFVSVFSGREVAVDSGFFVLTVLPIAVLVAMSLYVALEPRLVTYLSVLALAAGGSLATVGPHVGVLLIAPALASLILLAVGSVTGRVGGRKATIQLAHLGMAVLLVGVAGSSFGDEFRGSMVPGDSVGVAGHQLTLREINTGEEGRFVFVEANFDLDGSRISPEIRAYEDQTTPVAEPALRSGPIEDVIVAVSLLFPDANTVEVTVFVRPLVTWVWAGSLLIGLAGLVALFGRDGAASVPRPPAREEQRSAGTTSGTPSR